MAHGTDWLDSLFRNLFPYVRILKLVRRERRQHIHRWIQHHTTIQHNNYIKPSQQTLSTHPPSSYINYPPSSGSISPPSFSLLLQAILQLYRIRPAHVSKWGLVTLSPRRTLDPISRHQRWKSDPSASQPQHLR